MNLSTKFIFALGISKIGLPVVFVNYKDENCARYGQFIDFPAMCIFCTPNVLYNCIYRIGG